MGAMEAIVAIVKNAWSSAPRIANLHTWLKLHNQHTKNLSTKLLPLQGRDFYLKTDQKVFDGQPRRGASLKRSPEPYLDLK